MEIRRNTSKYFSYLSNLSVTFHGYSSALNFYEIFNIIFSQCIQYICPTKDGRILSIIIKSVIKRTWWKFIHHHRPEERYSIFYQNFVYFHKFYHPITRTIVDLKSINRVIDFFNVKIKRFMETSFKERTMVYHKSLITGVMYNVHGLPQEGWSYNWWKLHQT